MPLRVRKKQKLAGARRRRKANVKIRRKPLLHFLQKYFLQRRLNEAWYKLQRVFIENAPSSARYVN